MGGVVENVGDREPVWDSLAREAKVRRMRRVLLVVNRTSGVGHGSSVVDGLRAVTESCLDGLDGVRAVAVWNHAEARSVAAGFLAESEEPALVIAGGGSGTLRAVIEGLCEAGEIPAQDRIVVAALRMGSGNPLARQFGIPADSEAGLRGILENLRAGLTAPCCIMRCEAGTLGGSRTYYAATMVGFGQFGRIPGDVDRLRHRWSKLRKASSRLFGIERTNHAVYLLACLLRTARCWFLGGSAIDTVEVSSRGRARRMKLLAGVALNFPLSEIPADPGVSVEDEAVSLHLILWAGRMSALLTLLAPRLAFREAVRLRLDEPECVELRLVDGGSSKCFLDEDSVSFRDWISLEVAGSLTFVPGPDYEFDRESEVVS